MTGETEWIHGVATVALDRDPVSLSFTDPVSLSFTEQVILGRYYSSFVTQPFSHLCARWQASVEIVKEVEVPVEREVIVEKVIVKEVPVEVIKEVIKEVEVEVERIVEVPFEREVVVEKVVTKEIPVEVVREVVKEVEVPVEKIIEIIKEVEVPGPERIVEVQVPMESKDLSTSELKQESVLVAHCPVRIIDQNTIVTTVASPMGQQHLVVPHKHSIRDTYYNHRQPSPYSYHGKLGLPSQDFHRQADDIYQSFANDNKVKVGVFILLMGADDLLL